MAEDDDKARGDARDRTVAEGSGAERSGTAAPAAGTGGDPGSPGGMGGVRGGMSNPEQRPNGGVSPMQSNGDGDGEGDRD